jgi:hypothetical protein
MAFTTPLLGPAANSNNDNTGEYGGYSVRVKGDGRVEAKDSQGATSMHKSVLNARTWIDAGGAVAPPEQTGPTIDSIDPNIGETGTTTPVTISGTGFTEDSTVQQDGEEGVQSTYVSATQIDAVIPGGFVVGALVITVMAGGVVSNGVNFVVVEPVDGIRSER